MGDVGPDGVTWRRKGQLPAVASSAAAPAKTMAVVAPAGVRPLGAAHGNGEARAAHGSEVPGTAGDPGIVAR